MIVWGADIGYRRISLAAVDADAETFEVVTETTAGPSEADEATTMRSLQLAAGICAERLGRAGMSPPDLVLVERPMVQRHVGNEKMHYSYALVMAALAGDAALRSRRGGPPEVRGVQVNTWRKIALGAGFGRADKLTVMAWARRFGYAGASHDESDAVGVAAAGVKLLREELAEEQSKQLTLGTEPSASTKETT